MTIQELLNNWKDDSLFGERHFERQSTTLFDGQELYLISVRCNMPLEGYSKLIEKHKFFQTRVQGLTVQYEINPKADEYICKQILLQLEKEFYAEYNDIIEEEITKKTNIISKEVFEQLKKELISSESAAQLIFINNKKNNIEIYKNDLPDMTFNEAVRACKTLGKGWRLPTIEELSEMYKLHLDRKGNFARFLYWSQTEGSENAVYVVNFGNGQGNGTPYFQYEDGRQDHDKDYYKYIVRPVRNI